MSEKQAAPVTLDTHIRDCRFLLYGDPVDAAEILRAAAERPDVLPFRISTRHGTIMAAIHRERHHGFHNYHLRLTLGDIIQEANVSDASTLVMATKHAIRMFAAVDAKPSPTGRERFQQLAERTFTQDDEMITEKREEYQHQGATAYESFMMAHTAVITAKLTGILLHLQEREGARS